MSRVSLGRRARAVAFAAGVSAALAASASSREARAFCGFYVSGADQSLYNNATQVVLMREGTRTVLSMQNNYQGPPQDFAMVVPVPVVLQKENVKTLPKELFAHVDQLAAPRLVEYWEQDPCYQPPVTPMSIARGGMPMPAPPAAAPAPSLGVKIEAKFSVGEYNVLILSARDSTGLDTWLRQEHYKIPAGAEPILRPYVASGMKFFVAKVDVSKVKFETVDGKSMAALSPLRFHYDAESFTLPIRLGLVNSSGTQDLIVHVLARGQRYEVANYPNVTVPTNFDVKEAARAQFGSFYASLFDRTLEKTPGAVITEYAWESNSCDPCPTPPLDASELATLGSDVLPGAQAVARGGSGPSSAPPPPRMYMGGGQGFVLTRLHARYGKDAVGEDLVFRAAPPIQGGREAYSSNDSTRLEHTAQAAGYNNFQARYAIRHPWTGPIACKNPHRGVWGGPPNGQDGQPKAATGTAFAPRNLQLASFVRGPVPDGMVMGQVAHGGALPMVSAVDAGTSDDGASAGSDSVDASAETPPTLDAGAMPVTPPQPVRGGCAGCSVVGDGDHAASRGGGGLWAAALAGALALVRRRRR